MWKRQARNRRAKRRWNKQDSNSGLQNPKCAASAHHSFNFLTLNQINGKSVLAQLVILSIGIDVLGELDPNNRSSPKVAVKIHISPSHPSFTD